MSLSSCMSGQPTATLTHRIADAALTSPVAA